MSIEYNDIVQSVGKIGLTASMDIVERRMVHCNETDIGTIRSYLLINAYSLFAKACQFVQGEDGTITKIKEVHRA